MSARRVQTTGSQSADVTAERFDLTVEAAQAAQASRLIRYIIVTGLTVVLAIVVFKFTAGGILGSSSLQNDFYIGAAIFTVGLAAAGYYVSIWMMGPSASSIVLDSHGVTLGYRTGKSVEFSWSDPRFHLKIVRTLYDAQARSTGLPAEDTSLMGPHGRVNWVSREAADALIAQAESHRVAVNRSEKDVNPFWGKGERQLIFRIGGR